MLEIRTRKVRERLSVYVRRRQVASLKVAPALWVFKPGHAEAGAGGKRGKVVQRTAEAGEDESIDLRAKSRGRLCGKVGAIAVTDKDYFACVGLLAAKGDERVEDGGLHLELRVVIGVNAVNNSEKVSCCDPPFVDYSLGAMQDSDDTDFDEDPTPIRS